MNKHTGIIFLVLLTLISCQKKKITNPVSSINWEERTAKTNDFENLINGSTYIPVYSQIYQLHEKRTYDLTVTASFRNVSPSDTVYILKADYYNTTGQIIKSYLKKPIFLRPLETIEIVISENDRNGGTGGNFIIDWAAQNELQIPLFEAIMISTKGQQGLSFSSRGLRIK